MNLLGGSVDLTSASPGACGALASRLNPPMLLVTWFGQGVPHYRESCGLALYDGRDQAFLTLILGDKLANATVGELAERTEGWIATYAWQRNESAAPLIDHAAFLERLWFRLITCSRSGYSSACATVAEQRSWRSCTGAPAHGTLSKG
jgi:hypothetical protein